MEQNTNLIIFLVDNWKEILAFSSPIGAVAGYFLGSKKRGVELGKAEAELDKAELENVALALKIYKETLDELRSQLQSAETMRLKVEALLDREIKKKERVERENDVLVSLYRTCDMATCPERPESVKEKIRKIRENRLNNENK